MQTNKDKYFRCQHFHLRLVLNGQLAESPLFYNGYPTIFSPICQSDPILSNSQLT